MPGARKAAVLLVVAGASAGCRSPAPPPPGEPVPAQQELPPDVAQAVPPTRSIDNRPYELIWNPRREVRDALVDFEFVLGWSTEAGSGLRATFERSQEQQLWGAYVGRLAYQGASDSARIDLRPPKPIPLHKHFDSINLWVYGDNAPSRLRVRVEDATGRPFDIDLGAINQKGWQLFHAQLSPAVQQSVVHPCSFVGFRFEGCEASDPAAYYLDSLSFYTQSRGALPNLSLPRPNLPLAGGASPGLRGTAEVLPFPISEHTVLPPEDAPSRRVEIVQADREGLAWTSSGETGELRFRCDPAVPMDGVDIVWNEASVGRVLVGSGLRGGTQPAADITVVRIEGDWVYVAYVNGLKIRYRASGYALVMDVEQGGGESSGYDLGRYTGPRDWRPVQVPGLPPFVTVGWLAPEFPAGPHLFTSMSIDWYRSNATEIHGQMSDGDGATTWGGVRYRARTDNHRLDVRERIVLTVAPLLDDVLPSVANPSGAFRTELADCVWVDSSGPASYDEELARTHRLQGWGMTNVLQCHLQACWQDDAESSSLRTRAAPRRGGDSALQSFIQAQQAAGWKIALYANPTQIHPLNEHWSENLLLQDEGGAWVKGHPAHYRVKAPFAASLRKRLAPVIAEKFSASGSYVHDLTAEAPWQYVDFDARVPGAGSFAQALYGVGEILVAEPGMVLGHGGMEGLYAGLMDGYLVRGNERMSRPFLPLFCLQRVGPLAAAFGAGELPPGGDWDARVDRAVATQLAYGSMAQLAPEAAGPALQCRSYYTMQPIQRRYAGRVPDRVAYWNGSHFVNTSEAITGSALDRSQLYLHYGEELELWVNGSESEDWDVRVGRDQWILPPFGWVAAGPDLLAVSVQRGGGRIDYVEDRGQIYYDGRGQREPFRGLASADPIRVHRDESGLSVHDLIGGGMIALGDPLGLPAERDAEIELTAGEGTKEAVHPKEWTEGMLLIRGTRGTGQRYRLKWGAPPDS